MRGLFSLLFGASMLLVIERAEENGRSGATVHYRRMASLFGFGMLHYWLIWSGDILALYALCGSAAFVLRHFPARALAKIGAVSIVGNMLLWALILLTAHALRHDAMAGTAAKLGSYQEMADALGDPHGASISADLKLYLSDYPSLLAQRLAEHFSGPLQNIYAYGLETMGLMAWGMALFKSGALTGGWPVARLQHWAVLAYGIGLPISVALTSICWHSGFETLLTADIYYLVSTPVRMAVMIGHLMLLLLLVSRVGERQPLLRVAAAGKMAFSNYILTSILMTSLFYGYGAGLFGSLSRAEIYLFVPPVWALMLIWSPYWLQHFRYGPLEWLWRSIVQGRWQPLRITQG
jgi:uncharacterized protein